MVLRDFIDLVTLRSFSKNNRAFSYESYLKALQTWKINPPDWVSLSEPLHFEKAARENPIVKAAINLLATSSSNGKKVAIDIISGEIIPWTNNNAAIQKAYQLLVGFPNPTQSSREFQKQGTFYFGVFGNRYVYANMPIGYNKEIDLMNIQTLVNLPSQFMAAKETKKFYDQIKIEGIVSGYALLNEDPVKIFSPYEILHFNEVNFSSNSAAVMGISKLEALKDPIRNTQLAFEAMTSILQNRGMQGIISPRKTDGMNANVPLLPEEKKEVQDEFKNYGVAKGQNAFLISPIGIEYTKTVMSSEELGIYKEFSNNAIIIGNEFGVPPELIKTYIEGATYENQVQSVRRLYQDTIIPMVSGEDEYWTEKLNTKKYGFKIESRWDHIPSLQLARKEKAIALNLGSKAAMGLYNENLFTWNQVLLAIDQPTVTDGNVYKFQRDIKTGGDQV
jgi:hypothetical protein